MADYVDDLELLEEHDLFDSASDASDREHAAGDSGSASESEPDDQERIDQLRGPVLSICSALGGYEEVARPDGTVESVYQLGDDCLGEFLLNSVIPSYNLRGQGRRADLIDIRAAPIHVYLLHTRLPP